MFDTEQAEKMGIYSLAFTNEDIMRSELCKFIVQTFEDNHNILHPAH
jgi:activator of HSP90 ATPase